MARLRWPVFSDGQRLVLVVGVILVLGFLGTSVSSYLVARASLRATIIQSELPLSSDNIYSEIQKDLLRPVFISSVMAQDTFLRDWVLAGEPDPLAIQRYLAEVKTRYGTISSFFVSDRTRNYYFGDGILKKVEENELRDVWYFRVKKMRAAYEINVDPDLANQDTLTIFINYRVLDYDGNFIGVTGVGLTVGAVRALVDGYAERFHRRVLLVDEIGQVRVGSRELGPEPGRIQDMPGLGDIAARVLGGKQRSLEYQRDGRTVLLDIRFVPELSWYLLIEQEEAPKLSDVRHALLANLLLCALVTGAVAGAIGWSISRYQARIERMAITDKLTGLLNREGMEVSLRQAFASERPDLPVTLLLIDIDHFKQINDRFGHLSGDAALVTVTAATTAALGRDGLLCRWGGDELLVLLEGGPARRARAIGTRIVDALREVRILLGGERLPLTVSIGLAAKRPGETVDSLLTRADSALYRAKDEGRDRLALEP